MKLRAISTLLVALVCVCACTKAAFKQAAVDLSTAVCEEAALVSGIEDAGLPPDVANIVCRTAAGDTVNLIMPRKAALLIVTPKAIK